MQPGHLPALRAGRAYHAADVAPVPDVRGEVRFVTSQVNAGLARRDLKGASRAWGALRAMPMAERVARTVEAGRLFREGELEVAGAPSTWEEWVAWTSRSTGLPRALVARSGERVAGTLRAVADVVRGLTRGVPPELLDVGVGEVDGLPLGFVQVARSLGAVLPSNAPGVHGLWAPALALGLPLYLKPGRGDPFTPARVLAAMSAAGLPDAALHLLPGDHDVGATILDASDRAMVFGGAEVAQRYAGRPNVEVHGPGFSKVLVGPDVDALHHLDVLEEAVSYNGGRSCINASTIALCGDEAAADRLAAALAERLAALTPRPLDDPDARLAAFADPAVARAIDASLDERLPGAVDLSARVRGGPRRVEIDGVTVLQPTVVRCGPDHALAKTELPFPFVAVVAVPPESAVSWLGPSLAVTVLGDRLRGEAILAPHIDRLHLGAVPTNRIRWDQPHEGNLFEATWRRRGVG
jgi:acyl-CoA reductase-like NAD-dependent aldehyde dehydrogenase